MPIKICSKNSLFSNCYFGSRPKCNHLFYYLWNLKPSLNLYSENLPTVLGYQASDDHPLLPSKLSAALPSYYFLSKCFIGVQNGNETNYIGLTPAYSLDKT